MSTRSGGSRRPQNTTDGSIFLAPDVVRVEILTESAGGRHTTRMHTPVPFEIPPHTSVDVVLDAALPAGPRFDWTVEWSGQSRLVRAGMASGSDDLGQIRDLTSHTAAADRFLWRSEPIIFLDDLETGGFDGWSKHDQSD